jgi:ribosomal protein S18 acetylase RimI-like enzyme
VSEIEIRPARFADPEVQRLVADLQADLAGRYGTGDETPVAADDFEPPNGQFLVAVQDGVLVGSVGWRVHGGAAELKRLYTDPTVRRQGLARSLLAAAEASARAHGYARMILETGLRQPEAIALYQACGYRRIDDFGHYRDSPDVRSFGRDL